MKKVLYIFIFTSAIFNSANAQWTQILYNQYASYNCIQFIDQNTGWHIGGLSCAKSTNGGQNWVTQFSFSTGVYPRWLFFLNANYGWVVCQDGNYLRTTNGGANWILANYPDSTHFRSVFFVNNITGWAAGSWRASGFGFTDHKVVKTTNGGVSWFPQVFDYDNDYYSLYFIDVNTGWVAGSNGRVLKTNNGGLNWVLQSSGTAQKLNTVFFTSLSIGWIGGLNGTIYKTTNSGNNWFAQNTGSLHHVNSIIFINSLKGWAVGGYNWIASTTNGGTNWYNQDLGTYEEYLWSLSFVNDTLGWASGGEKIYKTTNGGIPLGIEPNNESTPDKFSLSQNYPNPFNPVTKIKFDVPGNVKSQTSSVKLIIYDILGREVTTLVNEALKPGSYETEWDGSNFASGIYFYSLQTEEFTQTKKMVLMK